MTTTDGAVTFTGPFQFTNLTLQNGTLTNGNNVTIATGGLVTRTDFGSITAGQLAFQTTAAFLYDNASGAIQTITTGLEFPVAVGVATNLTTTNSGGFAITLQLDQSRTINGILTTDAGGALGPVDLNGFTLSIVGANAHNVNGHITGGTLAFTLTAAAGIASLTHGAVDLPIVTANKTTAGLAALTLAASTNDVGNLTASGNASVTAAHVGTNADVALNGAGTISTANGGTTGNVVASATSTGIINLGLAAVGVSTVNSITQSGLGLIDFTGGNVQGIAVTTNVLLDTAVPALQNGVGAAAVAGLGLVTLSTTGAGVQTVVVTGSVTNSATFSGSSDVAGNNGNAIILFGAVADAVTVGSAVNSVSGTFDFLVGGAGASNGEIIFAQVAGSVTSGPVTNSSTLVADAGAVAANIKTNGALAGTLVLGAVSNTSSSSGSVVGNNGIDFSSTVSAQTASTISQSGSTAGGDILFGNANLGTTGNVTNSRSVAGADIIHGLAAGAGTLTIAGILENSGASDISFVRILGGAVAFTSSVNLTGTGDILFANASVATFGFNGGLTVSGTGTLDLGDETFDDAVNAGPEGATGTVTFPTTVLLTNGTIDFASAFDGVDGGRAVNFNGTSMQIGGALTNPTFTNSVFATLTFTQPIPNVNQVLSIGTADPVWPGLFSITNAAVLPAPYIFIQSINPAINANFYVTNNVLFNTAAAGVNTVRLDNAWLNVGKKGVGGGTGNFQNTTGYSTINGGRVMMSGNAAGAQVVNAIAAVVGATFGDFGIDNDDVNGAGTEDVDFQNVCTFIGAFYLAAGETIPATPAGAVTFQSPAPYPVTVYRTEGLFLTNRPVVSAAGERWNVTYYGTDKATALECPANATDLNDLLVATTNGATQGKGIITVSPAGGAGFSINGTLTVNTDQTFLTNNNPIICNGDVVVNGLIVNDGAVLEPLQFGGTSNISGSGLMCSMQINDGATVTMSSPAILADGMFGTDNNYGGAGGAADDFVTADGSVTHQTGGAGTASSVTLSFPALAAPYTAHFTNLVTSADANETVTLASDITLLGNVTHANGTIDLADFRLTNGGVLFAITGTATTVLTSSALGELLFPNSVVATTELTVNVAAATIAANVRIQLNGAANAFDFNAAGLNLTITGDLTIDDGPTAGNGSNLALGAGRTLTCSGANVTVDANSQISGTGVLILDVVLPNTVTTFTLAGTPTITNMTILNNVNLTGIGAGTLVVTNLIHTGGLFDFGSQNVTVGVAGVGTFLRNGAGTYSGTGTFTYIGAPGAGSFSHSSVVAAGTMTINNLQFSSAVTLVDARELVVMNNLTLNGVILSNRVGAAGPGYVTVGDATTVPTVNVVGVGEVALNALTFGNANADYNFTGATNAVAISALVWPIAPSAVARNVTVNRTLAASAVQLGASRIVSGTLTLTSGVLLWDSPVDVSMPTAGQLIVRNVNGILNNDLSGAGAVGTFTAPDVNIDFTGYAGVLAAQTPYNTGLEYSAPVIVRDVELLAMPNGAGGVAQHTNVTFATARTIAGTVTLSSVLTVNANTTFALGLTVPATGTVNIAALRTATYNAALAITGGVYNNVAATSTTTVLAGGLSVSGVGGTLTNAGTINVTGGMDVTTPGVYTGAGTLNLDGLTATGGITLGGGATVNMTGDATFAALVVPGAAPAATINTPNDLTFGGIVTGTFLNLVFTGANGQAVSFAAATGLNNVTLNKTADELVSMDGANVTLNAAGAAPAGLLTLTRGILVVGDVNPTTKAIFTIQATVAGGIITNTGFLRNPALQTNKAHVSGQLGVFIPAGSIGRTQWPVGSGTVNGTYRPAAITFTAGNATIAPTTFIVDHQDGEPTGEKNLPLIGGTQFLDPLETLWIGGKAPYQWLISATTSLGASQQMDVELQGSNINEPLTTVNDLRIIRRFDGNVEDNGWFIEGGLNSYSNQLVENQPAAGDTLLIVRNQNSIGSAVAQRAIFTIGIPSQAQTFTITGNVLYDDAGSTPFDGATVNLRLAGAIVASTTTVAGAYTFAGLNDGEYTIDVTYTAAWGGPNATDAQWVSQYFNGTRTLTGMKLAAGDVNASTTVNNTDALLIVKRFAGQTTSFAAGDWLFESPTVTIQAADLTQDVLGIMTGDVRGVASPGTPKVSNVSFMEGDMLQVNPKAEFEMPIQAASDMNIGAASIHFNYASDMVELVSIKAAAENMIYTDVEGYVTIAWADLTNGENAMNLKENDAMFVLTFKPTDKFTEGTKFSLELTGDNELASVDGTVMNKGNLKAPMVESFVPKEFALQQNYPNPFNPSTIIEYSLPEVAKVTLTIYNVLGQQVARLLDVEQEAGLYQFNWNASGLASGMYIYNINVETPTKSYTDSKRMMLLK